MKPHYSKAVVQPVVVEKNPENVTISYHVFPESVYFSKGVNYEVVDDVLKVYIDRCNINETCKPMAETTVPLDAKWEARVSIPYRGEKVVLVHTDSQEQIYP